MNLHQLQSWQITASRIAISILAAASLSAVAGNKTLQALPDEEDPVVIISPPSKPNDITQTREQNAVTSVRVRRGDNIYYIKPHDYAAPAESGGRAAQWQILEFNRKTNPVPEASKRSLPPPTLPARP